LSKFSDLDLALPLLRALEAKKYKVATPIQIDAIPPIMQGRDLIGCAQTGTGKTAAFALPTLHRLLADGKCKPIGEESPVKKGGSKKHSVKGQRKIRVLVLAPTRELAAQVEESFTSYGRYTKLRQAVIYGGVSQVPQVRKLRDGVDTLIATPGRLLDLINQRHVDLSHVEILIFDEADQMLDMGFIHDLRRIESYVPSKRQTLMFSATMPPEIRKLASEWLDRPADVQTARIAAPAEKVDQSVYFVTPGKKVRLLEQFLHNTDAGRTLVFSRTKHGANKLVRLLNKSNIRAEAIHGNKSQAARKRALEQFKSKSPPVLVATDVAARGLDITGVQHVINYDLPETPETYVHRIGRTGRAGAAGCAVSFCTSDEVLQLRSIERLTQRKITIALDHPDLTSDVAPAPTEKAGKSSRGGGQKPRWQKGQRGKSGAGKSRRSSGGAKANGQASSNGEKRGEGTSGNAAGAKRRRRRRPAASSKRT
jgi:ATP-dependent RNA helicase RhlE